MYIHPNGIYYLVKCLWTPYSHHYHVSLLLFSFRNHGHVYEVGLSFSAITAFTHVVRFSTRFWSLSFWTLPVQAKEHLWGQILIFAWDHLACSLHFSLSQRYSVALRSQFYAGLTSSSTTNLSKNVTVIINLIIKIYIMYIVNN